MGKKSTVGRPSFGSGNLGWRGQKEKGEENHASGAFISKTPGREKGLYKVKNLSCQYMWSLVNPMLLCPLQQIRTKKRGTEPEEVSSLLTEVQCFKIPSWIWVSFTTVSINGYLGLALLSL